MCGHRGRSNHIVLTSKVVLSAIQFDHQAEFQASEVSKIAPDRMLPTEAKTLQAMVTQVIPETALGIRRIPTQLSGEPSFIVGEAHGESMRQHCDWKTWQYSGVRAVLVENQTLTRTSCDLSH
jgi:hypothetical protein